MNLKKLIKILVNFCAAILILKMKEVMQCFQHIVLYYFKKGKNTTETQKKPFVQCTEKGEGPVTDQMCPKCFAKFCAEDL